MLQSEIDAISGLDDITSLVERVESCCDLVVSIESVLDEKCSQIDANTSRIDVNETMIDMLKTSTGELQSEIDAISGIDDLESLIELIESCCDLIISVESQVDVNTTMIDMLKRQVCLLEYKVERFCNAKPSALIPGSYHRVKNDEYSLDDLAYFASIKRVKKEMLEEAYA